MRIIAPMMILIMITATLAGCTDLEPDGEASYVDDIHVYIDGGTWGSDEEICNTAIVLEAGEYYACPFTANTDVVLMIELDVKDTSPMVDLITMDDLNYEAWKDGDAYYYKEGLSDFETHGGTYGGDGSLGEGTYYVVVANDVR